MNESQQAQLRALPAIDQLLRQPDVIALIESYSRALVSATLDSMIKNQRQDILSGATPDPSDTHDYIARLTKELNALTTPSLQSVINGTGIILHTNLGRAPLPMPSAEAAAQVARGYSNLEFDLTTGKRGSRYTHAEKLICTLTGAESALVVNNNAAAVLLVLNTLAHNAETIISRGELVEIGGSFRIPDVMIQGSSKMIDVGCTNRTRLSDYENAITNTTKLIMKAHPSNYRITGFTGACDRATLQELCKEKNLTFYEDLGSGALVDLSAYGLPKEETVQEAVSAGVSVVSFSGDKLMGGPQAGIIVGQSHLIDQMKKNPLLRAIRIDKLCLAALESTLALYLQPDRLTREIPALQMATRPLDELRQQANDILSAIGSSKKLTGEIIDHQAYTGGGSLPESEIESIALQLKSAIGEERLAEKLRAHSTPIIGRIHKGHLILDMRTINPNEAITVRSALAELAS